MENSSLTIENVAESVVNILHNLEVGFKNETYMSPTEDEEYVTGDDVDVSDLISDDTENDVFYSTISFPLVRKEEVIQSFKMTFGEVFKDQQGGPVWKFGRKDSGQLWVYDHGENVMIDIRYYYVKM